MSITTTVTTPTTTTTTTNMTSKNDASTLSPTAIVDTMTTHSNNHNNKNNDNESLDYNQKQQQQQIDNVETTTIVSSPVGHDTHHNHNNMKEEEEKTTSSMVLYSELLLPHGPSSSSNLSKQSLTHSDDTNQGVDNNGENENIRSSLNDTGANTPTPQRRLSKILLIVFSFFPLAMTSAFTFSLTILLPMQLVTIVGDTHKTLSLGIIGAIRALAASFAGLGVGYASDHLRTRFGRRIPFIVLGTVVNSVFLLLRVFLNKSGTGILVMNASVLIFGDMAGQMAMTCYMSLFKDLFHHDQMGLLSGLNSFVQLLASAIGISLLGFLYETYVTGIVLMSIVCGWMLLHAIVLAVVFREPDDHYCSTIAWGDSVPATLVQPELEGLDHAGTDLDLASTAAEDAIDEKYFDPRPKSRTERLVHAWEIVRKKLEIYVHAFKSLVLDMVSCFKSWNFVWLFLTRCLFTLAVGVIQTIGLYYFRDKVGPTYSLFGNTSLIADAQQALAVFMLILLLSGLVSSIFGGVLSDKLGRRPVIVLSCLICGVGIGVLGIYSQSLELILVCGSLGGLGVGAFMAADLSLANDIIDPESSAKELATFQMAQAFPLILSGPMCSLVTQFSQRVLPSEVLGTTLVEYNIMLLLCSLMVFISGLGIWMFIRLPKASSTTDVVDEIQLDDMPIDAKANEEASEEEQSANIPPTESVTVH